MGEQQEGGGQVGKALATEPTAWRSGAHESCMAAGSTRKLQATHLATKRTRSGSGTSPSAA